MKQRKLSRFLIVGVGSSLFYFALSWMFQARFGFPPFFATGSAYFCSFCAAYLLQHRWTFRSDMLHSVTLPRYAAVQALAALLTAASTQTLAYFFPSTSNMALAAASTLLAGSLSFVMSSTWVFAHVSNSSQ